MHDSRRPPDRSSAPRSSRQEDRTLPTSTARPAARPSTSRAGSSTAGSRSRRGTGQAGSPVLVRYVRGDTIESVHRGHVVEADPAGSVVRVVGDPEHMVSVGACVNPFALLALVEAGGIETFDLSPAELAVLAGSHSGEDVHVRTLQAVFRRSGVTQQLLACGTDGAPMDALTGARLARDGERPGPIRHPCSGQHAALLLLSRLRGWPLDTYWHDDHPAQAEYRSAVARAFNVPMDRLRVGLDDCGLPTFAFSLRSLAVAYAILGDPGSVRPADPRRSLAPALSTIRDAMVSHPEMVAGTRERLDTSLMKAVPEGLLSKRGEEGLRAFAILRDTRGSASAATGMALKIEDGGSGRAPWAASVEALAQAGVLEGQALRVLGRYQRPVRVDPHGRLTAEAIAEFELAPVGELLG